MFRQNVGMDDHAPEVIVLYFVCGYIVFLSLCTGIALDTGLCALLNWYFVNILQFYMHDDIMTWKQIPHYPLRWRESIGQRRIPLT